MERDADSYECRVAQAAHSPWARDLARRSPVLRAWLAKTTDNLQHLVAYHALQVVDPDAFAADFCNNRAIRAELKRKFRNIPDTLVSLSEALYLQRHRNRLNGRDSKAPVDFREKAFRTAKTVRCVYCGHRLTRSTAIVDHLFPFDRGGEDKPINFQLLCGYCNAAKCDAVGLASVETMLARPGDVLTPSLRFFCLQVVGRCLRCGARPSDRELFVEKQRDNCLWSPLNITVVCERCDSSRARAQ